MYQDLIIHHDWPVEEAIVNLPIKMKGNLKHTSGNLMSLLRAQSNDTGTASQMLLTIASVTQARAIRGTIICRRGKNIRQPTY